MVQVFHNEPIKKNKKNDGEEQDEEKEDVIVHNAHVMHFMSPIIPSNPVKQNLFITKY